ncbi:MAG: hypothetical protein M1816_006063 [Peltula sp. TS41687]|nr:MAG: hypothetical protein M1816_006063 [Peltula sp. TS41687]
MRCILGTWLVILSLSAALAAPATKLRKRGSFTIKQVGHSEHFRVGSIEVRKAFTKYGWAVPQALHDSATSSIEAAAAKDANSTVRVAAAPKSAQAETQFLVPVSIAGQELHMNIDTGSSDFWVFSSELPKTSSRGHAVFDPAKSPTFKPMNGATFGIQYGDMSAAIGVVGTDTVNIGGVEVQGQAVELATKVSGSFVRDLNSDGLGDDAWGLPDSLSKVEPKPQKTFFENAMPSLEQPVFTAVLKRGAAGSYEFGVIDKTKFRGELNYVPVDSSKGWWQFDSPGVVIGGQSVKTGALPSIADTGTSILLMQDQVVQAYYAQVQGAQMDTSLGGFVYPCDTNLPDLGIMVTDSYTATIPGNLLTFSQADANTCFGALQSNEGQPVQILGDTFFNSQFVIFDGGNLQMGMAPHAEI